MKMDNPVNATICDHTSVGVLVRRGSDLLLIERKRPPYGFAPPAGHVDHRPTWEDAARAELCDEVGLSAGPLILIFEGRKNNHCRRTGGNWRYWKVYSATASGVLRPNRMRPVKRFGAASPNSGR